MLSFLHPARSLVCVAASSLCLMLCPLLVQSATAGETITYDGSDPSKLRPDPVFNTPNALFPNNLKDNTITITGGTIGGEVFGGLTAGLFQPRKTALSLSFSAFSPHGCFFVIPPV